MELSRFLKAERIHLSSSTKVWIIAGFSVAGAIIVAEVVRRRRTQNNGGSNKKDDFGAFIERFELLPSPQPPPPAARHPLANLTFAISDSFDVKGYVTGFGSPDWKRTHDPAIDTAAVISYLLKNGATCVGRTIMDELAFSITGENAHYGTPTNPYVLELMPGGSSSGSAVAVAAGLIDFSLGTDVVGCLGIPASLCGVFGFRPSHGTLSTVGVLMNSRSLETSGFFARDVSVLHRVGHVLLEASISGPKRRRRFIIADDCFQLSRVPKEKTVHVLKKAIENLSGYQPLEHINIGRYIALNVPSLKEFCENSTDLEKGISSLKALSAAMLLIQKYEFKTNHEEWIKIVQPKLGPDISRRVLAAMVSTHENNKSLYKVRTELRSALNNLLKEGILVIPTVPDIMLRANSKKKLSLDFEDRAFCLSSIAGMSGCCQVSIPLGKHEEKPISLSFIAAHGADKYLLDSVLDIYHSLQEQAELGSTMTPSSDLNGDLDASELLKEKGNAAFKRRQWNKAASYYSEAIKLNNNCSTYYCNRAAAYLELECFQQAEADCSQAILLDKKNVKAYLRRGTARESLLSYEEATRDFKHALVLEPQNKTALVAERRLRKLMA